MSPNRIIISFIYVISIIIIPLLPISSSHAATTEITAGVPSNFPPQYSVNKETGEPEGFAIEFMDEIAQRVGLSVRYIKFRTWPEVVLALKEGRVDIIPNFGITEERKSYAIFTVPYETSHIEIFVRHSNTGILGKEDLQGKSIAVVKDNKGLFIMKELGHESLIIYPSVEEAFVNLLSGNADALVYPAPPIKRIAINSGLEDLIKTVGKPLLEVKRAIAVRKSETALLVRLDDAVKAFVKSPRYTQIYIKWYGKPEPYWTPKRTMISMGVFAAVISILLILWRYISLVRLNRELRASIYERKKTEDSLRDSEERVRAIFDNVMDGILIADAGKKFYMGNKRICQMLGYSAEELAALEVMDIHTEKDLPYIMDNFKRQVSGELTSANDIPVKRKDGSVFYADINTSQINFAGKQYVIGIFRDITERKQAEQIIQEQAERNEQILQTTMEGFILADTEGNVLEVNPSYCDMTGYTREELLNMNIMQLEAALTQGEIEERIKRLVKQGRDRFETRHRRKDGRIIDLDVSIVITKSEEMPLVAAFIHDKTESKKLENQLLHSQKMEAVGQLAGGVAHDFNNILAAIMNYAYLLKTGTKEHPPQDLIEHIISLTVRGSEITQALLAFSRKRITNPLPMDLNNSINNIGKLLRKFIGADIQLNINLSDQSPVILADSTQLDQILVNLATNARDAMTNGGSLTIETGLMELTIDFIEAHGFGEPGSYAVLSVSDTGEGMDEETSKRIFEPFFTTKEVGKGTGLGLSIIYGIVKQHNGYITVYSELGKGSTFRLYFKMTERELEKRVKAKLPDLRGNQETVLIAEDEEEVRQSVKDILENYNYKVIEAVDGNDAIKKFREHKDNIRLLVFDIVMPGKNGSEALEEIRKLDPGIKAIFTTGYSADVISKKGLLEKEMHLIMKPVVPEEFLLKIKEVLQ